MRCTPCTDTLYIKVFHKLSEPIKASSLSVSKVEIQDFESTVESFAGIACSGIHMRIFRELSEFKSLPLFRYVVKIFIFHYTHASLEKITHRLTSKWLCSGRHLVNVATRDDGPAAVKSIHSRTLFSSLTGTKRGLSCWTQRTSRITWPTWLTRLWKNWTSWPTWTTWTTRPPCNIWLR